VKRIREADGADRDQVAMADDIGDINGVSGNSNKTTGDTIEEGAV
jgi:hypothetical protein